MNNFLFFTASSSAKLFPDALAKNKYINKNPILVEYLT